MYDMYSFIVNKKIVQNIEDKKDNLKFIEDTQKQISSLWISNYIPTRQIGM